MKRLEADVEPMATLESLGATEERFQKRRHKRLADLPDTDTASEKESSETTSN